MRQQKLNIANFEEATATQMAAFESYMHIYYALVDKIAPQFAEGECEKLLEYQYQGDDLIESFGELLDKPKPSPAQEEGFRDTCQSAHVLMVGIDKELNNYVFGDAIDSQGFLLLGELATHKRVLREFLSSKEVEKQR